MTDQIVSGMRPTGPLHLGHYLGVIKNWVQLQEEFPSYFFLADWHALTSNAEKIEIIKQSRYNYIKGWIASGVDPNRSVIYCQSAIPEVLFLSQVFLCLTPPGWADRSPSWKDSKQSGLAKDDNLGFYTYPVLQTADIAVMKGTLVPVGEDQVAHVEMSREIVRKFNRFYKANIPEPSPRLTSVPKLLGIDGQKMSSSKGNVISLEETEKSLQKKVNKMKTDDLRGGIEKPGNPDNCSVFDYHKIFSCAAKQKEIASGCRGAQLGCGECKKILGEAMKQEVIPISEKIKSMTTNDCDEILNEGNKRAKEMASKCWDEYRHAMKF